jgi:hypothetical protein
MLTPLVLAAALAAVPPDTVRGTIRGSVLSEGDGLPLRMAVVEVDDGARTRSVATDSAGNYLLPGVPAGRRTLRVRHLEHAPLQLLVLVPPRGEVALEVSLKPAPLVLPGVDVEARIAGAPGDDTPASRREAELVGERVFQARVPLGNAPGAGGPGGADAPDPRDVLYARGAAADLKLVLLDGAPIYAPFHMGGLIETFEPEALGSARLYLGGAPARYDGGLSYVMEMRSRAGRGTQRTTGSVDVVSARVLTEGPLAPGATYLASFRGVHGGILSRVEDAPFPYRYAEGLARFDFAAGPEGTVRFTGFINREGVRVDTVADGRDFARWRNGAVSLQYAGPLGGAEAEATAAISEFRADIPTHGQRPMTSDGRTRRARLALDLSRQRGTTRLRYGASYDRTWLTHVIREYLPIEADPQAAWVVENEAAGDVGGVYVDAALQPTPRLGIRVGARGDYFSSTGGILSLSPRVAATWLLTDHAALTLAGGRYHQYVRVPRTSAEAGGNAADSLGLATVLAVARATHVALSLDQQLTPDVRMGLEGYFKHYEGIATGGDDQAYISGVDVWARRPLGPVTGWLGYSLTWAWRLPYEDDDAGRDEFAGRHVVTAGLGAPLGSATRFDVRVAYGAGLDTGVGGSGAGDGIADPLPELGTGGIADDATSPTAFSGSSQEPYLRVDAEISRTWRPTWGGRRRELTPYLRVLNGLESRDPLFYRYDDRGRTRALGSLPIVPVAGFTFRF